uniref:Uncharacterized protein n=1 Tax=Vibrio parahaemolyticus TaxID=670 RepID=A0A0C5H2P0_VIBPH|nr:hypothetical protein pVPH1_0216 [Vibrio parahaemolyticus]
MTFANVVSSSLSPYDERHKKSCRYECLEDTEGFM